jgi:hypothetical protein
MSITWQDEHLPIAALKHPERNVRIHGDKQVAELRRSLKLSGQRRPLIIDEGNTVLVGNGLLMAMRAEGYDTVWCTRGLNMSEAQKKKIMIADNRTFELGYVNHDVLEQFFNELQGDLDIPGYDESVLAAIVADTTEADRILDSFGIVGEAEKARMERREQEPTRGMQIQDANLSVTDAKDASFTPTNTPADASSSPTVRRVRVTCPACGETIEVDV